MTLKEKILSPAKHFDSQVLNGNFEIKRVSIDAGLYIEVIVDGFEILFSCRDFTCSLDPVRLSQELAYKLTKTDTRREVRDILIKEAEIWMSEDLNSQAQELINKQWSKFEQLKNDIFDDLK